MADTLNFNFPNSPVEGRWRGVLVALALGGLGLVIARGIYESGSDRRLDGVDRIRLVPGQTDPKRLRRRGWFSGEEPEKKPAKLTPKERAIWDDLISEGGDEATARAILRSRYDIGGEPEAEPDQRREARALKKIAEKLNISL